MHAFPQREHYSHLLDNERRMIASLRSSLQAKERELTEAMDKFLQEKVGAAKTQGELAAVSARLETAQHHISSLNNKVSTFSNVHVHKVYMHVHVHIQCMVEWSCIMYVCTCKYVCIIIQLSNLRAKGETKTGDDNLRQLELEQLRRQLHQLQISSEV